MGNIDLNKSRATRAAQREGRKEGPTFTLGKPVQKFKLPVEMPYDVIPYVADAMVGELGAVPAVFKSLMGEKEYARFVQLKPTVDDMFALLEGVLAEYGFADVGESSASES